MSSNKTKHKKSPGWRVHPDNGKEDTKEMDTFNEDVTNNMADPVQKLKEAARKSLRQNNAINMIANLKTNASKWRKYATTRRQTSGVSDDVGDRRRTGGMGLDYELKAFDATDGHEDKTKRELVVAHNRNLIEYFARLGQSKDENECINLEYVESLLKNGAMINCTDKYGQTILHEVARAWHVDVAQFLLDHGANIDIGDNYGRTPLHVAAAVDYPEMVNFLIKKNANKEATTKGEKQTPVHYAARNDACLSLRALIKNDCQYKHITDHKGRTPLHVAAELDRSESARLLLELNDPAPAGVLDDSGQASIVWMITKMPPVAKLALDQFHKTDRANRKQYYYMHQLEPRKPGDDRSVFPQTALQVVTQYRRYDLILHPVLLELIELKWKRFGRLGAWVNMLYNFVFILLWTIQGLVVEYDQRHIYNLPQDWWRILLICLALISTGIQLKDELSEFFHSKKAHKQWKQWRENEIKRDLAFAHPRWPEEEAYLKAEIQELDKMSPQYFTDLWNIFDWIVYTLLLTSLITHLVDVLHHTNTIARLHIRIMAVTVILIWLRLMKNVRAFSTLGPFIVIISHMGADIIKFAFLYLEFYIPFACAFWMLFGENKVPESYQGQPDAQNYTVSVDNMDTVNGLMMSLFRLTLVDDYDYDGMKSIDSVMADILVGTWLALSAILMLNLFIALMSDTFQRVYDNAKANAVMQKAITILGIEEGMSHKRREKFREFIHSECAPEVDFYDDDAMDDDGDSLKKVAFQIKDDLDELKDGLSQGSIRMGIHGDSDSDDGAPSEDHPRIPGVHVVTMRKFNREMSRIKEDIEQLRLNQEDLMDSMKHNFGSIKSLLKKVVASQTHGVPAAPALDEDLVSSLQRSSSIQRAPVYTRRESLPGVDPSVRSIDGGTYRGPGPARPLHTGRRMTATLDNYKHRHDATLLESTDDEWEKSEANRKRELEQLRRQVLGDAVSPAPDVGRETAAVSAETTDQPTVVIADTQQGPSEERTSEC